MGQTTAKASDRRRRKAAATAALPVLHRHGDLLQPVYEADPEGRPVVHHRVVDTLGRMRKAGTINDGMHDAARDFQASFTIASYEPPVCLPLDGVPGTGSRAELTDAQLDARRRVMRALDALGGIGSPAGGWSGTWSGCSARSASGRCARAGAAARSARSRRKASSSPPSACSPPSTAMPVLPAPGDRPSERAAPRTIARQPDRIAVLFCA